MSTSQKTPAFRLCIWQPVCWPEEFLDIRNGIPLNASHFQKSIYSLSFLDDPRDVLESLDQADRFKKEIIEQFAPSQPPSERSIEKLRNSLRIIDDMLMISETRWMDSQYPIPEEADAHISLLTNRLLAFRQALEWLCDTFQTVNNACVTIR